MSLNDIMSVTWCHRMNKQIIKNWYQACFLKIACNGGVKMLENKVDVNRENPSKTAETIAMVRVNESRKPEAERVCHDPYAIRFISQGVLDFAAHNPEKYKAFVARNERLVPGASNSIVARVRFFDDIVKFSIDDGIEQLVILGAGYDTRAYRIEGMNKIKVFEIDHPATQKIKIEKIKEIFNSLPDHVTYIPLDLEVDKFGQWILESKYDSSKRRSLSWKGF